MKLEVGMYVRTNLGEIGKVTSVANDDIFGNGEMKFYNSEPYLKGKEIKASYNIIDLIEVGDYVNGEKVIALKKDIPERNIHMNSKNDLIFVDYDLANNWYYGIDTDKIETILTKEQFENNVYRIGE